MRLRNLLILSRGQRLWRAVRRAVVRLTRTVSFLIPSCE